MALVCGKAYGLCRATHNRSITLGRAAHTGKGAGFSTTGTTAGVAGIATIWGIGRAVGYIRRKNGALVHTAVMGASAFYLKLALGHKAAHLERIQVQFLLFHNGHH